MKRSFTLTLTTLFLFFMVTECDRPEDPMPEPEEFGYLSLSVALQVEALPASGRAEAVSPDNFIVTIYNADDGTIAEQWNTYVEVPAEVQLPTGSYYVTATNLAEPEDAAFEQPWYFGESDVFTIDKEELKSIDVDCTLANCKISFNYTQNVHDNFTNWDATGTIDDGNGTGAFLEWIQDDPAEGYFLTNLPIDIEVFLEYIKLTGLDQSITRTFNTTIGDPQPATHYRVNVDASLEDGKIMLNITVDDSFTTKEINLGDQISFRSCKEILDAGESAGDGIYQIDPDGDGGNEPYDCYCDMTTDGGGWTRVWGKTAYSTGHPAVNLSWEDALNRVPQETVDMYTGLNIWNELMSDENSGEFMNSFKDFQGTTKVFKALIGKFRSEENYTLKLSNKVSLAGDDTNSLYENQNNLAFSSFDRDNDPYSMNCSVYSSSSSPFWFSNCWGNNIWGWGEFNPQNNAPFWNGYGESSFYYIR